MGMIQVRSSAMRAVGYDQATHRMRITLGADLLMPRNSTINTMSKG